MRAEGLGETSISTEEGGFRLLGAIGKNGPNRRLVTLRHVGIRVPQPLDGAGALDQRSGNLTFEKSSFVLGRAASRFVEIQLALQSRLLDEHGLSGLFCQKRVPQYVVVQPPRMVGGEVNKLPPIGGRRTILNAALVLADRD